VPRRSAEVRDQQLLLRVTANELDVLDAAAHLQRSTANAYVYELVRAHVAALRTNTFVMRDVENRKAFEAAAKDSKTVPFALEQHADPAQDQSGQRAADKDA
jgi:uncharacterized protein (DUF1778 family)